MYTFFISFTIVEWCLFFCSFYNNDAIILCYHFTYAWVQSIKLWILLWCITQSGGYYSVQIHIINVWLTKRNHTEKKINFQIFVPLSCKMQSESRIWKTVLSVTNHEGFPTFWQFRLKFHRILWQTFHTSGKNRAHKGVENFIIHSIQWRMW